ncbi:MAG: hypothetical protein UW09_C0004G0123 [candidate division TM6 bacterium GW2011_GWF2_43_87]|nr:MAG: hypothetical protein UW09_C0004G0123 [candidate division TM6 bacterium GW2011_GWF2_43_87]
MAMHPSLLLIGAAFAFIAPIKSSPNLSAEGWIKNLLPTTTLKALPYVWTPNGWIINSNRKPYFVNPQESVMFDWIVSGEISPFRQIIRGARVEFLDNSHPAIEIWYGAITKGFVRGIIAGTFLAKDTIGINALKGPAEKPTLSGSWIANGAEVWQEDSIDDETLKVSIRGVSYPLASPDAEFVFKSK